MYTEDWIGFKNMGVTSSLIIIFKVEVYSWVIKCFLFIFIWLIGIFKGFEYFIKNDFILTIFMWNSC